MQIKLIVLGKTDDPNLKNLIEGYQKRLQFYTRFEIECIPDLKNAKNMSENQQKEKEGALILDKTRGADAVVLLDEKGKNYTSEEFAGFLQKKMNAGTRNLVFVTGGPYGFSNTVYEKFPARISLSKMTFSHQMVRLFFTEQLYRAFTILRNEPYHHR